MDPAQIFKFFSFLKTSTGRPFTLMGWQKEWIQSVFGTLQPDGSRRYRESCLWIARQNGKSELMSGLMLCALLTGKEKLGQYYSIASDREQAGIVFRNMKSMIDQSATLSNAVEVIRSTKTIRAKKTDSFYRSLSADAISQLGNAPMMCVYDEVGFQRNDDLYNSLNTGMVSKPGALMLSISTAGHNKNLFGYRLYERTVKAIDRPDSDPRFYGKIYSAPQDITDDQALTDESAWAAANPGLGVTIQLEDFRAMAGRARAEPSFLGAFRRYHLNLWADSDQKWIPMSTWMANQTPVDPARFEKHTCYAGIDLSRTDDTTAVVLNFPMGDEGYFILPFIFAPSDTVAKREREGIPYSTWVKQGFLKLCPGPVISYDMVLSTISDLMTRYEIREFSIDPFNAQFFTNKLKEIGGNVVSFQQGFISYNGPCKEFERSVAQGRIHHGGHPVLAWQVGNAVASMDPAENIKPDRTKSTDKIDSLCALIMTLRAAQENRDVNLKTRKPMAIEWL